MRILITGGSGFIGSNFILYWMDRYPQDEIINLDKLTYAGNLDNLSSVQDKSNYHFVKGDICDSDLVDDVVKGVDVVVHFAAESHVDRSIIDLDPFVKTNVEGTVNLLKAALKHKVARFHHISTDEVFGQLELDSNDKFNEDTCYNPRSAYAASKAAADHFVRIFSTTYGLPITISNCSNNYGPYQFPEKFIALAITNLLEEKPIPVYGDGMYARDWLYVQDHCRAIDFILKKGKTGQTYLVGGMQDTITNIDLAKKIVKLMDKDESYIVFVKDRPGHDRRYAVDWSKIKKDLGWKPEVGLDEGLRETIEWYKKNRSWWEKIKSGEYQEYYKSLYGDI